MQLVVITFGISNYHNCRWWMSENTPTVVTSDLCSAYMYMLLCMRSLCENCGFISERKSYNEVISVYDSMEWQQMLILTLVVIS